MEKQRVNKRRDKKDKSNQSIKVRNNLIFMYNN